MGPKKSVHFHENGWHLKNIILGGQDGVVNILGLVLGVAAATQNAGIVLISGLASTFAESLSMAAVAYTSSKAAKEYYLSEIKKEKEMIRKNPRLSKKEITSIFKKKGFEGKTLHLIVNKVVSSKRLWLSTILSEEMKVSPAEYKSPLQNAFVVGSASLVGSLIPLVPFWVFSVKESMYISFLFSILVLFLTGAYKAKITIGDWKRAGIEMAGIGALAALAGYGIGIVLGTVPY